MLFHYLVEALGVAMLGGTADLGAVTVTLVTRLIGEGKAQWVLEFSPIKVGRRQEGFTDQMGFTGPPGVCFDCSECYQPGSAQVVKSTICATEPKMSVW